jgi:hypothetical protein
VSRLLEAASRLAPLLVEEAEEEDAGPANASVKLEAELLNARLPRDAFPIPWMDHVEDKARCLETRWARGGKQAAPGKLQWTACEQNPPAPAMPYYYASVQLFVVSALR